MLNFDAGFDRLQALKALGLRLALDDYGTGYSSLNRLRTLPVDIVKIDKSFIDQLTLNREGTALVQSVIDVTRAIGLSTIAEGVERQDQYATLDEMKCNHIQGYLFAKPMPPADAARLLQQLGTQQARPHRLLDYLRVAPRVASTENLRYNENGAIPQRNNGGKVPSFRTMKGAERGADSNRSTRRPSEHPVLVCPWPPEDRGGSARMSRRSVQRLVLVQIPTLNGGPDLPANARVSTVTDRTRDPKGRLVRWANGNRY